MPEKKSYSKVNKLDISMNFYAVSADNQKLLTGYFRTHKPTERLCTQNIYSSISAAMEVTKETKRKKQNKTKFLDTTWNYQGDLIKDSKYVFV